MNENHKIKNAIKSRIGPAAANTLPISPRVVLKVRIKTTKKTRLISRLTNAAPLFTPQNAIKMSIKPNARIDSITTALQKDYLLLRL
jgi:hypothetical protein